MDPSAHLSRLRQLHAEFGARLDLGIVRELLDEGNAAFAAAAFADAAEAHGIADVELWRELEQMLRALGAEGNAEICAVQARLHAGELTIPFTRLPEAMQSSLAPLLGSELGPVLFLEETEACVTLATWEQTMPLGDLVPIAEGPTGDLWVVDLSANGTVGVLSHDLVLDGQVERANAAVRRVCESLDDFIARARSGHLPSDYYEAE